MLSVDSRLQSDEVTGIGHKGSLGKRSRRGRGAESRRTRRISRSPWKCGAGKERKKNDHHPINIIHLPPNFINNIKMLKIILICLVLILASSDIVPCTETQESPLASISDCSAHKQDQNTLEWGVRIHFKKDVDHQSDNWMNLLSDNVHPRLPYFPLGGICKSDYGHFENGQSVLLNCTQDFEDIPGDYVNTVILLEDSNFPLVF